MATEKIQFSEATQPSTSRVIWEYTAICYGFDSSECCSCTASNMAFESKGKAVF